MIPASLSLRRPLVVIWSVAAALVLGLALAVALLLWGQHKKELSEREAQLARFAAGAEAGVNRGLLALDVLLATLEELLTASMDNHYSTEVRASGELLAAVARQNLMLRELALFDAHGALLASSALGPAGSQAQAPSALIDRALAQVVPMLVLGEPRLGTHSGERVLHVARALHLRSGVRVVAVALVPVEALAALLLQGLETAQLEVTLERAEGALLVGVVPPQGLVERSRAGVAPLGHADTPEAPSTAVLTRTRLRGEPGLVTARPLMYEGLWITVGMPRSVALAPWRNQALVVVAGALLMAATVLLAALLASSYVRRLHRARLAVARSKALLDQALGVIASGFMLLDAEGRVVQWNQRFEEFFPWLSGVVQAGASFHKVLQTTAHYHLPGASPQEKRAWVEERERRQADPQETLEQVLPGGRTVQITERTTPDGGLVILYHDVTALRQATAEVELLAFYDPLTGLPNRRLLLERVDQACSAAQGAATQAALLFIDLDHFKTLNDTLGHETGDQLLQQVARRLESGVRACDTVARLGGDEFVVMLVNLSREADQASAQARRVAEHLALVLAQPYQLGLQQYQGGASVGVTLFGEPVQSATEVLKQADIAMYQAKAQRGNGVCFFDPAMQVALSERARLVADLKQAVPGEQLLLYLQPQFDSQGSVAGVEALLRWQHPERGLVLPGQFIGVAEDSELIGPIGRWVLEAACRILARWQDEPALGRLHLSVNVSARQFRQPDFVAQVLQALASSGARAQRLELELTESLVLEDVHDSIDKMLQLRTKGVRFALDDFGTGYSSLAYLTRLPLHRLKIDRSFVQHLGERDSDDVIVQTIIAMARSLELETVAEGVETQKQCDFLARHGCSVYQGYLFARPMPVADLQALVRSG